MTIIMPMVIIMVNLIFRLQMAASIASRSAPRSPAKPASAIQQGCDTLLSEDMRHGQVIEGVTIVNPFRVA